MEKYFFTTDLITIFLFFFFINNSMIFLLQESFTTSANVPAGNQWTKRTRNLAGEDHSNQILSIRNTREHSRYLDWFTRHPYIHYTHTLYIYFTLCFGKSLALYLPCHRTFRPLSNFVQEPRGSFFFYLLPVERIFAIRIEIPERAVTNVQTSLRDVDELEE